MRNHSTSNIPIFYWSVIKKNIVILIDWKSAIEATNDHSIKPEHSDEVGHKSLIAQDKIINIDC